MTRNVAFFLFFFLFPVIAAGQEDCAAIVEYNATIGDPEKADRSPLFTGSVRTVFLNTIPVEWIRCTSARHCTHTRVQPSGEIALQWTFVGGEIIDKGSSLLRNATDIDPREAVENISFKAETDEETQTITLGFNLSTWPTYMHEDITDGLSEQCRWPQHCTCEVHR